MNHCFYHRVDMDGKCSAAIVRKYFEDKNQNISFHGVDYQDELSCDDLNVDYMENVYMVDFSLQPYQEMIKLSEKTNLVWIDHHKSAIDEYSKHPIKISVLDTNFAACELCWSYFFITQPIPAGVELLGRYDIWDHKDPNILLFQYGCRNTDTSLNNRFFWNSLLEGDQNLITGLIEDGKKIKKYIDKSNEKYCKVYSKTIMFEGYKTCIINKGLANSMLFDFVREESYDLYIAYVRTTNNKWKFSLYSETIDTSIISKKYGGGGHPGASGFQLNELPKEFYK